MTPAGRIRTGRASLFFGKDEDEGDFNDGAGDECDDTAGGRGVEFVVVAVLALPPEVGLGMSVFAGVAPHLPSTQPPTFLPMPSKPPLRRSRIPPRWLAREPYRRFLFNVLLSVLRLSGPGVAVAVQGVRTAPLDVPADADAKFGLVE